MKFSKTPVVIASSVIVVLCWLVYSPERDNKSHALIHSGSDNKEMNVMLKTEATKPTSEKYQGIIISENENIKKIPEVAVVPESVISHTQISSRLHTFDVVAIQEPVVINEFGFSSTDDVTVDNQPDRLQLTAKFESQFESEAYDSVWASEKEAKLNQEFADLVIDGNQLYSASCRATLCRIEVIHNDVNSERRFIASVTANGKYTNRDEKGFYYRAVDFNEVVRTIYYLSRDGYDLIF